MELVFVSSNQHKASEIQKLLNDKARIISLKDLGFEGEIPETADTFSGNALLKARFIYNKYGKDCFADDSGLEVEALNGEPGVYSARYAGEPKNDSANTSKLLSKLIGESNRKANFKTVIALIISGKEYLFEGCIYGKITFEPRGENGFGYDPVFIPDGHNKTFSEMNSEEKNSISHRAQAIIKMNEVLGVKNDNC